MSGPPPQDIQRAIATISQSDPITKLLQEVRLGRMKPTDLGLRAIAETWLGTYRTVLESGQAFDRATLLRLDPSPRLEVLIEAGVLTADHHAVRALRATFERKLSATTDPT